ncbi:MAG: DUF1570 domain-containing protein [Thermoguttaceae bacterium]|jgi:hypothetical protein
MVPTGRLRFHMLFLLLAAAPAGGVPVCSSAAGADQVAIRRDGKMLEVEGRILLTAQDGGILLLARDGVLWNILPEEQVRQTQDKTEFRAYTPQEMSKRVLAELPGGFNVYPTAHYLIFYDTSRVYAQWCGSLFERLYGAFRNAWSHRGFEPNEPEFPLVAVIFADKRSYAKFSEKALGEAGEAIVGYFNLVTNRMIMCDLTGAGGAARAGHASTAAQINQVLSAPDATQTVATIVHEATHQIAFNCGLNVRLSDCPLWLSEGIAMYFETPDLHSAKGWAGVGAVNRSRLAQLHAYLPKRPSDSLKTLLATDRRFRDVKQSLDAYAEAWAMVYFLLHQHPKEFVEYLKLVASKQPLVLDGPDGRLAEFEKVFGPWKRLDAEFLRFITRVR